MENKREKHLTAGRLIESVMLYRKLNAEILSKMIGEDKFNFYKLLNGRRKITENIAVKLGKALNMSQLLIMESVCIDSFENKKNQIL